MASGDFTQRVDIRREDEIGVLANSFNAMAKSLDEKTKEIAASEKRYRELVNSIKEGIRKGFISYCKKNNGERFISETYRVFVYELWAGESSSIDEL